MTEKEHEPGTSPVPVTDPVAAFALGAGQAVSAPLCKLIETVASGIGVLYKPIDIRRRARAEGEAKIIAAEKDAQAEIILARGEEKVAGIRARAEERLLKREIKRQENIESVAAKAVAELPGAVSEDRVDPDWARQFFEHCQDVGNEQMQSLWARLLAGEVARPGTYSLRTLALVRVLRQKDAQLFTRLCSYVWAESSLKPGCILTRDLPGFFGQSQLSFDALTHLHSLGLILFDSNPRFSYAIRPAGGRVSLSYFGRVHAFELPAHYPEGLPIGGAMLTSIGCELAPISGAVANEGYRRWAIQLWRSQGVKVTE